jgi:hypothetical protein
MIKLIHDITQSGYLVEFEDDFSGMITINYKTDSGEYIRHEHISFPGGTMDQLESSVIKSLEHFLNETKIGEPKRDGLAESINKKLLD